MNNQAAPVCSVSRGRGPRNELRVEQEQDVQQEHNMFGDTNLNMVFAFMLMLHFMQYAMRPPCGC